VLNKKHILEIKQMVKNLYVFKMKQK